MTGDERDTIRARANGMDDEEIMEMLSQWDIAYIFNELERRCRRYADMENELRNYTKHFGLGDEQ